jgi:hypothetical protein
MGHQTLLRKQAILTNSSNDEIRSFEARVRDCSSQLLPFIFSIRPLTRPEPRLVFTGAEALSASSGHAFPSVPLMVSFAPQSSKASGSSSRRAIGISIQLH